MERIRKNKTNVARKICEVACGVQSEERGASDLVTVVVLIVIVLAVAVVFRKQLTNIIKAIGSKVTRWIASN